MYVTCMNNKHDQDKYACVHMYLNFAPKITLSSAMTYNYQTLDLCGLQKVSNSRPLWSPKDEVHKYQVNQVTL